MRGLIEKGFVYIARPPLYRVKTGRTSRYIADDLEMARFLIDNGSEGMGLTKRAGKKIVQMPEDEFMALVTRSQRDRVASERLGAVMGHQLLADGIVASGAVSFAENGKAKFHLAKAERGIARLSEATGNVWTMLSREDAIEKLGDALIGIDTLAAFVLDQDGVPVIFTLSPRDLENALTSERGRIGAIETLWENIAGMTIGSEEASVVTGPLGLVEAVVERGRKGIAIQRYKGLGEMNPEQLWETTLDPENRILKQVSIDDLEETEGLFVSLMGDEVRARREHLEGASIADFDLDL
jgi:DNA gyrase subunit B